jgi:hypothetical protein
MSRLSPRGGDEGGEHRKVSDRAATLLRACVAALTPETLVLRAHERFDDVTASVDVVTGPAGADAIEDALRRSLPGSR